MILTKTYEQLSQHRLRVAQENPQKYAPGDPPQDFGEDTKGWRTMTKKVREVMHKKMAVPDVSQLSDISVMDPQGESSFWPIHKRLANSGNHRNVSRVDHVKGDKQFR
jgi:hypothetical protein